MFDIVIDYISQELYDLPVDSATEVPGGWWWYRRISGQLVDLYYWILR